MSYGQEGLSVRGVAVLLFFALVGYLMFSDFSARNASSPRALSRTASGIAPRVVSASDASGRRPAAPASRELSVQHLTVSAGAAGAPPSSGPSGGPTAEPPAPSLTATQFTEVLEPAAAGALPQAEDWVAVPPLTLQPGVMEASRTLIRAPRHRDGAFPAQQVLQVTSDAVVAARGVALEELLPCFRNDSSGGGSGTEVPRYDVAFIPIGCFGDPVAPRRACVSTSCLLGPLLAQAMRCGSERFGAFIGDNFYPWGLRSARDRRFELDLQTKFWRHRELQVPFYATVGNHDKRPHTQLRTNHPFWVMPAFHHASPVHSAAATTQLFLIDTHYGFERNTPALMRAEADWLDAALRNSTARWKIVASHEPIWGFLDFTHSAGLVEMIHPVLLRHRVALYVAAHAHSVHFHRCRGGYYQLISAGFADNIHQHVKPRRPPGYYHLGRGGAAVFFTADFFDVAAFDTAGNAIFSHRVTHPEAFPGGYDAWRPDAAFDADAMWRVQPPCEAFRPYVPAFCKAKG